MENVKLLLSYLIVLKLMEMMLQSVPSVTIPMFWSMENVKPLKYKIVKFIPLKILFNVKPVPIIST